MAKKKPRKKKRRSRLQKEQRLAALEVRKKNAALEGGLSLSAVPVAVPAAAALHRKMLYLGGHGTPEVDSHLDLTAKIR